MNSHLSLAISPGVAITYRFNCITKSVSCSMMYLYLSFIARWRIVVHGGVDGYLAFQFISCVGLIIVLTQCWDYLNMQF